LKISIFLPAYNEEKTIEDTILDFYKNDSSHFIYVIDNNSNDKTAEIAQQILAKHKIKGGVLKEKKQGKGFAMRLGFQAIDSDIYVVADADSTYKALDLQKLLMPVIEGEADMVVGDRHQTGAYKNENKRRFHNFGNGLVKKLINFLFNSNLQDIMSGYRVMSRRFIKNFPLLSNGFEVETEISLHAVDKRFNIIELPITYTDRPAGSFSKLNTVRDGLKVMKTILWIFKYYKPFHFFGVLSLFFFVSGICTGFPVLYEFYHTKYILHVPLAILTMGLMVMSLLSFSIGLVLDTIVKFHKFDFEWKLNQFVKNSGTKLK
jgi:glycosyltransferase involved in cell wall biosynthesis